MHKPFYKFLFYFSENNRAIKLIGYIHTYIYSFSCRLDTYIYIERVMVSYVCLDFGLSIELSQSQKHRKPYNKRYI